MDQIICKCGCGREFDRISWSRLVCLGVQTFPRREGKQQLPDVELRNCPCGSTKALRLDQVSSYEETDMRTV